MAKVLPLACFYGSFDSASTDQLLRGAEFPSMEERIGDALKACRGINAFLSLACVSLEAAKVFYLSAEDSTADKARGRPNQRYKSSDAEFVKQMAAQQRATEASDDAA